MLNKKKSTFPSSRQLKSYYSNVCRHGRSLRFEAMEGRLVLSASGFAGNECAPELDNTQVDQIVPSATQVFSPGSEISFSFQAADVVTDAGAGATAISDIQFTLDPDVEASLRNNGSTPIGATLVANDQGTTEVDDDTFDFSWTPAESQQGIFRLFIIAIDDGGTDNIPLSDVYAFELSINDAPTVDLNGDDEDGIDFAATFVEGGGPVAMVDADLTIPIISNDLVASATVEISAPQAGGVETLSVTGGTLLVDSSTPGRLVISVDGGGLADKSLFENALRTLTYDNSSDNPVASQAVNVTVNDGTNDSDIAVATITNTATNDRAVLLQIETPADAMVGVPYLLDLVAEDPDAGDLLVFQIQLGPDGAAFAEAPAGSSGKNTIQVARDATTGQFNAQILWTPTEAEGDSSPALLRVSVSDTGGLSDSEDYSITIANQGPVANDDPTAGNDPLAVGEDDGPVSVGNLFANDSDADGDSFSLDSVSVDGSVVGDPTSFTTAQDALVTIDAAGNLTYNPSGQFESLAAGQSTTDSFQYTIIDENGNQSGQATVTVTINGANDAPTAVDGAVPEFRISEVAGATELPLAALLAAAEDVDAGDVLSVAAAPTNPAEGGLFSLNGVLTFDPNGDFDVANDAEQTVDFMVTLQDTAGAPITIAARIIIEGGNDAPVAVSDPDFSTDEETQLTVDMRVDGVLANDTDDGGNESLTVAQVNGDAGNVGTQIPLADGSGRTGQLTVNSDGTFTFSPDGQFEDLGDGDSTTVIFTYIATDGGVENNLSIGATVTITINGVNDAPVASDVAIQAAENGSTVDGVFAATDAEAGALTYALTSTPATGEGSVVNNDDGTFTFDPGDDFQDLAEGVEQDVTFNYRAIDAAVADSAEATVTVTVTGQNDAPVFDLEGVVSELSAEGLISPSVDGQAVSAGIEISSPTPVGFTIDLSMFTTDIDGDNVTFSLDPGDNDGAAFREGNRPSITPQGILTWAATADDVAATDYVIRVRAADQPVNGGATSATFDLNLEVFLD